MGLLDAKQNCDHQGHEEAKDYDAPLKQPAIAERRSSSDNGNIRVNGQDVLLFGGAGLSQVCDGRYQYSRTLVPAVKVTP